MGGRVSMVDPQLRRLISDDVLDAAYAWLCSARRDYPPSADIWNFRRGWENERILIKQELAAGRFRFGVLDRIIKPDGSEIDLWAARDALVLKALSIVLGSVLPVSSRCTHVKRHGGAKAAVRQVRAHVAENRFVLRTDVKSYFDFLGYRFGAAILKLAEATIEKFVEQATRLYEQGRRE